MLDRRRRMVALGFWLESWMVITYGYLCSFKVSDTSKPDNQLQLTGGRPTHKLPTDYIAAPDAKCTSTMTT
jgi:hypothetical protein